MLYCHWEEFRNIEKGENWCLLVKNTEIRKTSDCLPETVYASDNGTQSQKDKVHYQCGELQIKAIRTGNIYLVMEIMKGDNKWNLSRQSVRKSRKRQVDPLKDH